MHAMRASVGRTSELALFGDAEIARRCPAYQDEAYISPAGWDFRFLTRSGHHSTQRLCAKILAD
jgi:hypothetical protein